MLLSKYFMPIIKDTPKDAHIISHRLMLRSGMIKQDSAGIYSWLPLGQRVLNKISNIIRMPNVKQVINSFYENIR